MHIRPFIFALLLATSLTGVAAGIGHAAPAASAGLPALHWQADDIASLTTVLKNAAREGLDPADYALTSGGDDEATRVALAYLSDLRHGRAVLRTLDSDVALPSPADDGAALLAGALADHRLATFLAEVAPSNPQYVKLKEALAFYRAVAEKGGWPQLPPGTTLTGEGAELLRARLAFEDANLGPGVSVALKRFQSRHGLVPDGKLNARTLAELNVSASMRADQIVANMERWRWLPASLEPDRIAVNVADASLSLVLNGQEMLTSRVVVGKPRSPTPILRAEDAGITINPPWNIPDSIAGKEILPKLKANPRYLQSEDMVLLNGPPGDPYGLHVRWRDIPAGRFPYRVQQHPGAKNALGTIKLELPNRFDVYLHDTPAKRAFASPQRDVSHGCVRVERILPLASYVVAENLDAMTAISDTVASGETEYLPLQRKLPVYFLYWTSFTANDGALQFRTDIYGRDQRLIAALEKRVSANVPACARG